MNAKTLCFLSATAAILMVANASAQTIQFATLVKDQEFLQTGPGTTTADPSHPWELIARFIGTGETSSSPTPPNTVSIPGGGNFSLSFNNSDGEWEYGNDFSSMANLNAAFPNNSSTPYGYSIGNGAASVNLILNGDLYPNAAFATSSAGAWSGGVLLLTPTEAAQSLTFMTNQFTTNFSAGSTMSSITISGLNNNFTANASNSSSSGDTFDQSSLTLNPASLLPGDNYQMTVEFDRLVDTESFFFSGSPATGVSAYATDTFFTVQIIPESATAAALFGLFALAGAVTFRRRARSR